MADHPSVYDVVLDVNVYLRAAELLDPEFTVARMREVVSNELTFANPHPHDPRVDSLRTIATCWENTTIAKTPLVIWANNHILDVTSYMARARRVDGGLGLSQACINSTLDFMEDLCEIGHSISTDSTPPLDHEDGMVYGLCKWREGQDLLSKVICVTNDITFINNGRAGKLSGTTTLLRPSEFLRFYRGLSVPRTLRPAVAMKKAH